MTATLVESQPRPHGAVIAEIVHLFKVYQKTENVEPVYALRDISLQIHRGEMLAIMGASGSGKSTLMNILGCLDRPTAGQYLLDGRDVAQFDDDALSEFRGARLGFIFQNFNLIPQLTVLENLEVPLFYQMVSPKVRHQRALDLCRLVGLEDRGHHRPVELSGGQQQRVAVARALMNDPLFLLADEPTGNLDSKTGAAILDLFHNLHEQTGTTILIVTHDPNVGLQCTRRVMLKDGEIDIDQRQKKTRVALSESTN